MTRTISGTMAGVLERLELEQAAIVTSEQLAKILEEEEIKTPARIVASRLREKGWFLPIEGRGVWEFIPAATAGVFSNGDALLPFQAFIAKHPSASIALTFQAAAWLYGVADRVPMHLEIAAANNKAARLLPHIFTASVFFPNLPYKNIRNVPVLASESVIVHMAMKPTAVRSWQSASEWLPELATLLVPTQLLKELEGRTNAVVARTGYLLQAMRPDIANAILANWTPTSKTWFGAHKALSRHDNKWLVADTLLPFDPRKMEDVSC